MKIDGNHDPTMFARKILAGVARVPRRAGAKAVVAMLTGRRSRGVRRLRLDELSTFGLLAEHTAEAVAQGFSVLRNTGLLSGRGRQVTPRGWRVMTAQTALEESEHAKLLRVLRRESRRLRKLRRATDDG